MNTDGGYGQYIKVPADWVLKSPTNLSMKEAMTIGMAGLTAGISALKLTETIKPEDGEIIVSGAIALIWLLLLASRWSVIH